MSINVSEIQVVVMAYRQPPCTALLRWLQRLPAITGDTWQAGSQEYGIDVARNQSVTRFLRESVPAGRKWLLMVDSDTIPLGMEIAKAPGDLLWLGYVGHQGSRGHVSDFGAGCFRASADLLRRMGPPWFRMQYNAELTRRLHCECQHFAARAQACGVEPVRAGLAGHQQGGDTGVILVPREDQSCGWGVLWPYQLSG